MNDLKVKKETCGAALLAWTQLREHFVIFLTIAADTQSG